MPRLRRADAHRRALGQRVPVENGDLLEMGRDGFGCGEGPIPAPMTTACLANGRRIGVSPKCAVRKAGP